MGKAFLALLVASCLPAAGQAPEETVKGHFRASAPWLVENFRHADVPQPGAAAPRTDPLLDWLDELHQATRAIIRQARLGENLWAATDAVREARANLALAAQLRAEGVVAGLRPIYLLAMRDQTVRIARSYRVEGDTLSYVMPDGSEARVPLESLDRELTGRLNRERRVEVRIPAPSR